MYIHFLHGFLGKPSDWNFIHDKKSTNKYIFHSIEDFMPNDPIKEKYLQKWAVKFNDFIFKSSQFGGDKNILVGYSLGGRLALHSLCKNNNWKGAIIVSANPGLTNENDKLARLENDKKWARRFLEDDWSQLMHDWNAQGVFAGLNSTMHREEKQYDRKKLSQLMLEFSLAKQENLRDFIKQFKFPIHWLAGERDSKFVTIAKEMSLLNNNIKSSIVPLAGHRIPWENSEEFVKIMNIFIRGC
jgi:2-succinyl-6-hydroxy-2,4-cyclohexadiene-1-carboxylate synthase